MNQKELTIAAIGGTMFVLLCGALVVAAPALAGDGAVATTNPQEVCSFDYAKFHRGHLTEAARRAQAERPVPSATAQSLSIGSRLAFSHLKNGRNPPFC